MLNPAVLFSIIWFFQLAGYLVYFDSFGSYAAETWLALFLGISLFLLGCLISYYAFKKLKNNIIEPKHIETYLSSFNISKFVKFFCFLFLVIGSLVSYLYFSDLLIMLRLKGEIITYNTVRTLINQDFTTARNLYAYVRFYHMGLFFVVFQLCFYKSLSRKMISFLFIIGLVCVVLTTSRLFALYYFMSLLGILFVFRIFNTKRILLTLLGFVFLFFASAVIFKKGYDNLNDPIALLKWNFQVYFFSPLAAFNHFIMTGLPDFGDSVLIPNSLKLLLNMVGFNFEFRPNLMPFVNVPVRTNVYTYLFPLYHDGGLLLVGIGSFVLGFLHQLIYIVSRIYRHPITVYIFAISLYPLAMTFFEDAYFSSPGILFMQTVPIFVVHALMKLGIVTQKNRTFS